MKIKVLKIHYSEGVANICVDNRDSLYYHTGKVPKEDDKKIKFKKYYLEC